MQPIPLLTDDHHQCPKIKDDGVSWWTFHSDVYCHCSRTQHNNVSCQAQLCILPTAYLLHSDVNCYCPKPQHNSTSCHLPRRTHSLSTPTLTVTFQEPGTAMKPAGSLRVITITVQTSSNKKQPAGSSTLTLPLSEDSSRTTPPAGLITHPPLVPRPPQPA